MSTLIIPAHNEEAVIKRCLDSVIQQGDSINTIIVACNGCTDNTVEIVKRYPDVYCLDLANASKTYAINEAERYINSYPVFYLDADTCLEASAIERIHSEIVTKKLLLAAPTPVVNTSNSSGLVKAFYRVWLNLPYVKEGVIATCSYVLTREGRQRFSHFPEIIADDGFVRGHFEAHEMANIPSAKIHIEAPKDILSLIKIKTRARLGNIELSKRGLCPVSHRGKYKKLLLREWLKFNTIDLFIYIVIQLLIRFRSTLQFVKIKKYQWERDNSTRA